MEEEDAAFSWEAGYAEGLNIRQVLQEDESGSIQPAIADLLHESKRKRRCIDRPAKIRLGIMRHVCIILDGSLAMTEKDLPPSRFSCVLEALSSFLDKFFEQNPISQLSFILAKDKVAVKLSELTGNIRKHKDSLNKIDDSACSGEFSLQNALLLALKNLRDLPTHVSREIIIMMGSLSTCDPTFIGHTFEDLKKTRIRSSVVSLSAEIYVCKKLCEMTGGVYNIVLDRQHLETVLLEQTIPPIASKEDDCNLVKMGFPIHRITDANQPSICICHMDDPNVVQPTSNGYFCPQCNAKYCNLPVECRLCRLTLVSAPQLARAFQHLTPLAPFSEISGIMESDVCRGCFDHIESSTYRCQSCSNDFCIDCDLLLHESLQVCPGCC